MLSKPASCRVFPTATLLAAALTLPALPGAAQQQVSSGNALDANQQVGSGGVNPNAPQIDFQRRNLLITGQVNDGRQFRGQVDYGAAGAFGGSIGSDDLFRFRADSFGTNRSFAPPLPGNPNGEAVIYNDYFSPQAGAVQPGVTRRVISPDGTRATTVRQAPGNIYNPDLLSIPSGDRPYISPADAYVQGPTDYAGFQTIPGNALRVEANPLFGVRPVPPVPGAVLPTPGNQTPATGQPTTDDPRFGDRTPENLIQARIDPLSPGSAAQGRLDGALQPGQSGATINPNARDVPAVAGLIQPQPSAQRNLPGTLPTTHQANTSPTQQIGQRLGPAAIAGQTNRGPGGDDQRLQRIGEAIFSPDQLARADEQAVEENSYLSLLTRIREQAEQRVEERLNPQGDDAPAADAQRDTLPRPAWMRNIEDPTEDAIKQAEDRRLNTLSRLLRIEQENQLQREQGGVVPQWRSTVQPNPAGGEVDPNTGEQRPGRPAIEQGVTRSEALQSLIRQLSYDLPRVETLQGNRETRVNQTFAQAEDALAKGNYFNAEAMYRQLILDAPDNPLARVGQVHSEMGAGMVRSAAFHLRQLFEKHPELIATRYAQNLLPPAERLQWLQGELQKAIAAREQSNLEPGLLLAYLGWQVESRQLVRYGLAVAQEAAPADPLLNVLRSIWLGEEK